MCWKIAWRFSIYFSRWVDRVWTCRMIMLANRPSNKVSIYKGVLIKYTCCWGGQRHKLDYPKWYLNGSGISKHVLGTCREVHDVFFFVWGLALHLILPPVLDARQGGGPGRSGIGPASSRGRQMVSHHRRLAVGHRAWLHTTIGLSHDAGSTVAEKYALVKIQ